MAGRSNRMIIFPLLAGIAALVVLVTVIVKMNAGGGDGTQDPPETGVSASNTGSQDKAVTPDDPGSDTRSDNGTDSGKPGGTGSSSGGENTGDIRDSKTADNTQGGETDDTMTKYETKAAEILNSMTLRAKICQMCIITPEQLSNRWPVINVDESVRLRLAEYPVGGIIYFSDNLQNPIQTRDMLVKMQGYAEKNGQLPLFLCIDEEGGKVVRIADNPTFRVENPGPMKNVSDEKEALEIGRTIGKYLSELGFNVDFAPDADVLTAPGSVIIGDRSFGDDPEKVTKYAAAVSDGLHEYGILSCFKHFPGHGAVEADTHKGLAYTDKSLEDLMSCEIIPFAKAEEEGVDMVMAAHISVPAILGDNTPCSLSEYMLTTVLKEKLGYNGLVITDALNMGAVTQSYPNGEAAVAVVKAGADILLMPPDLEAAVSAIEAAVQNGDITEERINESVKKIIIKKLSKLFTTGEDQ